MNANTIYSSLISNLSNTYFDINNSPEANNFFSILSSAIYNNPIDRLETSVGNAPSYSARAWCKTDDNTSLTIGKNISSVSEPSSSRKRFNFTIGPADTNYAAFCTAIDTAQRYGTLIEHTNSYCTFSFSDDSSVNDISKTMFVAFW